METSANARGPPAEEAAAREAISFRAQSGERCRDQNRKSGLTVEVTDPEWQMEEGDVVGRAAARRSHCACGRRDQPEVNLGGSCSVETLMRTQRRVVKEPELDLALKVAKSKRRHELQVEHFFERAPEALDDGDRAGLSNRTVSEAGTKSGERLGEGSGRELRAAVGDEVVGLAESCCGFLHERGDLGAGRFLGEDPKGNWKTGVNVEDDDELEDPDLEERRYVGDVGDPDVVRFFGSNRRRRGLRLLRFDRKRGR